MTARCGRYEGAIEREQAEQAPRRAGLQEWSLRRGRARKFTDALRHQGHLKMVRRRRRIPRARPECAAVTSSVEKELDNACTYLCDRGRHGMNPSSKSGAVQASMAGSSAVSSCVADLMVAPAPDAMFRMG